MNDQSFQKYKKMGAYHWEKISRNPGKFSTFLAARYKLILNMMGEKKDMRILDLGCGDGALSGLISKKFGSVVGIDPNELGLELARQKFLEHDLKGEFYISTADFNDCSFECIVLTEVIEHLDNPDIILREVHRLLRPNGFAIITTPIRLSEKPIAKEHVREYYPTEFISLISDHFEIVESLSAIPCCLHEMTYVTGAIGKFTSFFLRIVACWLRWNYLLSIKGNFNLFQIQLVKVRKVSI